VLKESFRRSWSLLPAPLRRVLVFVVGFTVLVIGMLLLVLPGPGILVIIVGLAILATEFVWARRLLVRARERASQVASKFRKPKDRTGNSQL
jgi:uncharacterized protein (TIGR02611 family)